MTVDQASFFVWLTVMFYGVIFAIYDYKCHFDQMSKLDDRFDKLMESIR